MPHRFTPQLIICLTTLLLGACSSIRQPVSLPPMGFEDNTQRQIQLAEAGARRAGPKAQLALALLYARHHDLNMRRQAEPLLRQLSEQQHPQAAFYLAEGMRLGHFGRIDVNDFHRYGDLAEQYRPGYGNSVAAHHRALNQLIKQEYQALRALYAAALNECLAPIDGLPAQLSPAGDALALNYVMNCQTQFSFGKRAANRLLVLAGYHRLQCQVSPAAPCKDTGYRLLATATFPQQLPGNYIHSAALALHEVFEPHRHRFMPPPSTAPRQAPGRITARALARSQAAIQALKLKQAVAILALALNNDELSPFERAQLHKAHAMALLLQDTPEARQLAMHSLSQAVTSQALPEGEAFETTLLLANLYLLSARYGDYLGLMADFITRARLPLEIFPQKTLQALQQTYGAKTEALAFPRD